VDVRFVTDVRFRIKFLIFFYLKRVERYLHCLA